MKKLLTLIALLMPLSTFALEIINDFEWLEPNNRVEVIIGEPYQLQFSCSDNSLAFTSTYADSWVHIDFTGGQHVVNPPTGYSIDENGVITGMIAGSYAIHPTGWVQAKSGVDKWLYITVVSERSETESNNTLDTANDITSKIRFGLYNISDIDYFRYTNSNLKWGDEVMFKIHYYGSRENPFGYKWATFCGTNMVGGGSLVSQDQECKALVTTGNTVYLEVYYDQSRSEYFNYGEEFVAEVFINGVPASEYGNNYDNDSFDGEGTIDSPYLIKNANDLTRLASLVNAGNSYSGVYFNLSDNIDMNGKAFEPIGNQEHPFSGVFDGKGFVIKGLSVEAASYIGLFGHIDGATINDVGIEEGNYRGSQLGGTYLGGIAGYSQNSVITNCYTSGLTLGNDCVGALVGYSGEGTIIQNCFSSMQHTKYEIYGSVGGLVGYNCGTLENSYYYGTINAKVFQKSTTGGIVGYNNTTGSIHYCYLIKYGDMMNGEFNYCGSLNWGDCYGIDSFDLYGITTSGSYLHAKLNSWVNDYSSQGRYRKWTSESFPSFDEYAEYVEQDQINGHEYVDLGLPSGRLWAKTNYGAMTEDGYGAYVDWPYLNIVSSVWGEEWEAPTSADMNELLNYCSFNWGYSTNNVYGCFVTGANNNSIFLPAAGFRIQGTDQSTGKNLFYWTSTESYESGFAVALTGYSENNSLTTNATYNYSLMTIPVRPVVVSMGPQPYAVLSDNNTILTFYYDTKKNIRKGMSVGPIAYDEVNYKPLSEWYDYSSSIKTVVFDDSFANCHDITSTAYWFESFRNLEEIRGLSNLNTENVTDMKRMFIWCSNLTTLDLSNFNTTNVTDMSHMFQQCSSLKDLNLEAFNTKNVVNMHQMFHGCSSITTLDLSSLNTENVMDMGSMFYQCDNLETLDLSNFDTANVTDMGGMFDSCIKLKTIYASEDWNTEKVSETSFVFYRCYSLEGGQGTKWIDGNIYPIYARIDRGVAAPGYFTEKTTHGSGDYEYVDLALPSGNLWAKTNIGANNEYVYGYKFAFGETSTKERYMEDSYKWLDQDNGIYTKYTVDGFYADI